MPANSPDLPAPRRRAELLARFGPESLVFVLALGARLTPEILHGGLTGNFGYDPSVYYAAADSLIHGRMPYRDFILLHPPGIALVDSPFAWLGSLTSDQLGFAALTVFFTVLGAVNAVLVTRVARRLGVTKVAALVGGVVYALYPGSLIAEYEARLEPLGCFFLLCALLALTAARRRSGTRSSVAFGLLAGLALGCAMSVKIWWTVPALVLVGWELIAQRAGRRAALMLAGLSAAVLTVDGPFWLIARSKMWQMVVLDQLHRPPKNIEVVKPLAYLVVGWLSIGRGQTGLAVTVIGGALVLCVLCVRAWRIPGARVLILVLIAQVLLITVEPTWFDFYSDYVTVALALVVAAGVVRREATHAAAAGRRVMSRDVPAWLAVALAACLAVVTKWTVPENTLVTQFPAARLAAAAEDYRCVMSDSPMALIEMNVLTSDLRENCPDLVDTTGLIFDLNRRDAANHERGLYRMWNDAMVSYLRSGDAVIFFRTPKSIDLYPTTAKAVERNGSILSTDDFDLFRVAHSPTADRQPAEVG